MTSATIRQIQHNFADVLRSVESGEEVEILRRNKPIARIVPLERAETRRVDWTSLDAWRARMYPAGALPGRPVSELISDGRGDR